MTARKCGCVYATSANTESVRLGYEMGGYLKTPCSRHARKDTPMNTPSITERLATALEAIAEVARGDGWGQHDPAWNTNGLAVLTKADEALAAYRAAPSQHPQAPAAEPASAFNALKAAIAADEGYAWSWHCNIAMPFMDVWKGEKPDNLHQIANEGAARFMEVAFGVNVRESAIWKALEPQWAALTPEAAHKPGVSAWRDASGGQAYGPTHFMPLPAPPGDAVQEPKP